jgi:3-oxoacyl-[acyl-carrier-protein] synthase-3
MLSVRNGHRARARLVAVGARVPARVVTNAELEETLDTSDEWITTRTGIRERRVAGPDEAASDLAAGAAQEILAQAGVPAEDIDVVLVATATPDHLFPATAALVAERIGARNAGSFDLMAGCTGFIYALAQACALVESGIARHVLTVGGETFSRVLDWTDRSTCVLFGDAGAGALISASTEDDATGFLGFDLGTDGSGAPLLLIPGGGSRRPPSSPDYRREESFIRMNGREVFKFATRVMVDSATRLLDRLEVRPDEIDLLVAHQANLRIIEHAVKRLGVPESRVFNNVDRYGNTSSASIPLALAEARERGRLRPGDLTLLVGFGAGLTWGSTVVRYEPLVPAAG